MLGLMAESATKGKKGSISKQPVKLTWPNQAQDGPSMTCTEYQVSPAPLIARILYIENFMIKKARIKKKHNEPSFFNICTNDKKRAFNS